MKLLENRTKQSKNEIELLESLEELKDLNKRQQVVDFDTMLSGYDSSLSQREREEKLRQLDEEYIKTVKFSGSQKRKVVVEEQVVEEVPAKAFKSSQAESSSASTSSSGTSSGSNWTVNTNKLKTVAPKKSLNNLIKVKGNESKVDNSVNVLGNQNQSVNSNKACTGSSVGGNGLSLLGAYSDSESDSHNSD